MTVLAPGTLIDNRYKVTGRIGSGGMADVYLCEDQHLGRPVALKVMHERFAADPDFVRRFEREAQAAAGLQHKNVVNVFDRGQVGDTYYIAMEYLQGRSLKDVINAMGALEPKLAIHIALQIIAAMRFSHSKGLVHRDIKPQNVMIDDEWNVKVTDFGIAHNPVAGDITQTGQMVGTAQYISPEQAQGKPVSASSDIYSMGAVLFEMLTGRVPFDGESSVGIALKHISEPPLRPSQVNPTVPPVLDAVVLKAMAKSPVERYASAEEFSAALEHARNMLGEAPGHTEIRTAPTVAAPVAVVDEVEDKNNRNWIIAACVVALLIIAAFAYFLTVGNKQTVPNVVGRSVGDAQARLASSGFKSQIFTQQNKAPSGEVFRQSPVGGNSAKKNSTVILSVSSGPGLVKMPDVSGMSQKEAETQLAALGLKTTGHREFSTDIGKGKATRTVPASGQSAEKGSNVDLYISKGPKQAAVPDVTGLDVDQATTKLEDAGFTVDTTEKDGPDDKGKVLSQTPAAGVKADDGSKVKLMVASGSNNVPDVTGLSEADATQQLKDAGFKVVSKTADTTNPDDDGNVISQDPPNGTGVVGTNVTITVGTLTPTTP